MQGNLFFHIILSGEQRLAFYIKLWYSMGEKEGKIFRKRELVWKRKFLHYYFYY